MWTANDYLTQVNLHSGELPESIRAAKRVLVVGGGNYWRGVKDGGGQMERSRADQMGMLATVMNSLASRMCWSRWGSLPGCSLHPHGPGGGRSSPAPLRTGTSGRGKW